MKLTADQFIMYIFVCWKSQRCSNHSRIRQLLILSTDNASFQVKNIRAGSPDLFMSMVVMGNLHYRLNFDLGKKNKIFYHS